MRGLIDVYEKIDAEKLDSIIEGIKENAKGYLPEKLSLEMPIGFAVLLIRYLSQGGKLNYPMVFDIPSVLFDIPIICIDDQKIVLRDAANDRTLKAYDIRAYRTRHQQIKIQFSKLTLQQEQSISTFLAMLGFKYHDTIASKPYAVSAHTKSAIEKKMPIYNLSLIDDIYIR